MANVPRVVIPVVVFGGLIAALIYSQGRTGPRKVSGFVESDQIRVGSRVGGRVARVLVEEGQVVERGTVLLELEPFDLLAQQARARAERDVAREEYAQRTTGLRPEEITQHQAQRDQLAAKLEELEHGPREQEILTAEARVRQADAQLELAKQQHQRAVTLSSSGRVSQNELDKATRSLRDAEGTLDVRTEELALLRAGTRPEVIAAAKAALKQAEAALALAEDGYRKEEIAQAKARLAATEAALQRIATLIAELEITAPVDGTVEAVDLQPGDLVTANAPVLSIMDTSRLWIRAYVPENQLDFPPGHEVEVTVDSLPDSVFKARITFLSRQAEFVPGNVQTPEERSKQVFRIKATMLDGLRQLRPGMSADVWLEPRK